MTLEPKQIIIPLAMFIKYVSDQGYCPMIEFYFISRLQVCTKYAYASYFFLS